MTYLPVDNDGLVNPNDVEKNIREDTFLVSIMTANNEIGTIQDIEAIGEITSRHGVLFHTDAVQALGHIPIDIEKAHIDLLSASAHKIGGPKGVGLLYMREGAKLNSFIHGGAQERGLRAGTENVASIVGFSKALEIACLDMDKNQKYETRLRDMLISEIESRIGRVTLNGDRKKRLPNNVNFLIEGILGESLLMNLDMAGIMASSGSACASGSLDPSHVIEALGVDKDRAKNSLRLSLSEENTEEEIVETVDKLTKIVEKLRGNK